MRDEKNLQDVNKCCIFSDFPKKAPKSTPKNNYTSIETFILWSSIVEGKIGQRKTALTSSF